MNACAAGVSSTLPTLDDRQCAQVFSVDIEEVKRDEDTLTTAEEQITKDWTASGVNECDFAIEDAVFNVKMFSDP